MFDDSRHRHGGRNHQAVGDDGVVEIVEHSVAISREKECIDSLVRPTGR